MGAVFWNNMFTANIITNSEANDETNSEANKKTNKTHSATHSETHSNAGSRFARSVSMLFVIQSLTNTILRFL